MADASRNSVKDNSIHEKEVVKPIYDGYIKGVAADKQDIYMNFASKDAEWRAYNKKKLLRKVDIRLLPLLILMYLLNFLDRSNLAQSRLGTLEVDLNMKGTDFNLATSILFVVCILDRGL